MDARVFFCTLLAKKKGNYLAKLAVALAFLIFAVPAFGQCYPISDHVRDNRGNAIAGATVVVLSGTTSTVNTTTQPGTPLATIYSDPACSTTINQSSNPATTDGTGLFTVYAATGNYVLQEYLNGVQYVIPFSVPSAVNSVSFSATGTPYSGQVVAMTGSTTATNKTIGEPGSIVTTTPYSIQGDSSSSTIDRNTKIEFRSGASVVNLCDPTATGCGDNFKVTLAAETALTVNATGSAKMTVLNGASTLTNQTSFNLGIGYVAYISSPDNANWVVAIAAAGACVASTNGVTALNAYLSAGCTDVTVPATDTSLTGALITVPKGETLHFEGTSATTFSVSGVRLTDSTTDYTGTASVDCPNGAIVQLAASANVDLLEDTNFSTLTGTTNQYGLNRVHITGCIWDGNKANNSTGWVAQLYGRDIAFTGTVQNGAQGGAWLENHDPSSQTTPPDDDNQFGNNIRAIDNGGDGIYVPAGQGWMFKSIATWGNSSWGFETAAPVYVATLNAYLNTGGGCHIASGGSVDASNFVCSTATGPGAQFDTGAGSEQIANGIFSSLGDSSLIWGGISNSNVHAVVDNTPSGYPAVSFTSNTAVGDLFDLTMLNNAGVQIAWGSAGPGGVFIISGTAPSGATCFSGTASYSYINATVNNATGCDPGFIQLSTQALTANGYSPHLPNSNGYLLSTGNTDSHYQTLEETGCTTGAAAGDNCATAITFTWTTAFPDTNYNVTCTGLTPTGIPSGPYVATQTASAITVNYFAITAAAASYANVFCTASER